MQEKLWDREAHPMELYDMGTGDRVSPNGWNQEAGQKATEFYWAWAREQLRGEGKVHSTTSLVKDNRGREYLGYWLTLKGGETEFNLGQEDNATGLLGVLPD